MIENAVNAMNDIGTPYGELDCITEMSNETGSLKRRSTMKSSGMTNNKMVDRETAFVKSILDTIPSELSRASINSEEFY